MDYAPSAQHDGKFMPVFVHRAGRGANLALSSIIIRGGRGAMVKNHGWISLQVNLFVKARFRAEI